MKTDYQKQAQDFLDNYSIKFRATLSDTKTAPWKSYSEKCGHHFRVTLSKANKNPFGTNVAFDVYKNGKLIDTVFYSQSANVDCAEVLKSLQEHDGVDCDRVKAVKRRPGKRLAFDFWSSIDDAEAGIETVTPYDVLACISGDTYCPDTFKDFCGEYGYEQDSIKALQQFRRCDRFAKRLREFFTSEELEALSEIQ